MKIINNLAMENIATDIRNRTNVKTYYYLIEKTKHSLTSGLYDIQDEGFIYSNETVGVFDSIRELLWEKSIDNGLWLIQSGNSSIRHTIEFNPELYASNLFELVIFQETGMLPKIEENKVELQNSIKQEKIKKSLVYSCYINDHDEILKRVATAKKASLNQKLQYTGTPLGLCAAHDFLEGFKAISAAGADLNKLSIVGTPLEIAFNSSPDIAWFIFNNYRDVFEKTVNKIGFSIASNTRDKKLLLKLLEAGCNIMGKDNYVPTLHCFVAANNMAGIEFSLENGFDINFKNKKKQTALDIAKIKGSQEVIDLLMCYGAV